MAQNIKEYVAERVIQHLKNRDEQLNSIIDFMKKNGIFLCTKCKNYGQCSECDFCDDQYCEDCRYLVYRKSKNLSGTTLCKKCDQIVSHLCWNCHESEENCECIYPTMSLPIP